MIHGRPSTFTIAERFRQAFSIRVPTFLLLELRGRGRHVMLFRQCKVPSHVTHVSWTKIEQISVPTSKFQRRPTSREHPSVSPGVTDLPCTTLHLLQNIHSAALGQRNFTAAMEKRFKPITSPCEWVEDYRPGGYHPVVLGDVFNNGQYKDIRKLGEGSYSTVWLARDLK